MKPINHPSGPDAISDEQICAEMATLLVAGFETTAKWVTTAYMSWCGCMVVFVGVWVYECACWWGVRVGVWVCNII